jgi:hypothetical protein
MPDYQKGKIYKLYSPSKNLVYYGSTVQSLAQRLSGHIRGIRDYNKDNNKKYCSSFLVVECEDYKIELLEEYPCNNKQQLFKKEGEYIRNNECVNKCIAGRTEQEYNIDNANKIRERKKKYRIANADKHKEWINQYRIDNVDKIKEYKKQYRQTNADEIKEYQKQYQKQYRLKKKLEQDTSTAEIE